MKALVLAALILSACGETPLPLHRGNYDVELTFVDSDWMLINEVTYPTWVIDYTDHYTLQVQGSSAIFDGHYSGDAIFFEHLQEFEHDHDGCQDTNRLELTVYPYEDTRGFGGHGYSVLHMCADGEADVFMREHVTFTASLKEE